MQPDDVSHRGRVPRGERERRVGEPFEVEADILCDGHDPLAAVLLHRAKGARRWTETPMRLIENDRWRGRITFNSIGLHEYTIAAWRDLFGAWRDEVAKKHNAEQRILFVGAGEAGLGIGATVGSVIPTVGAIVPAAVGVDIGCGMAAVQTTLAASDLPESLRPLLDRNAVRLRNIPAFHDDMAALVHDIHKALGFAVNIPTVHFEPKTVLVPQGKSWMGSPTGEGIPVYETPQHQVDLPAFRIGIAPVTNEQFQAVFGQSLWIIVGSVTAFAISQLVDVAIFWLVRHRTGGRFLWMRATGSTVVSQLIDSIVIIAIAFWLPGKIKTTEFFAVAASNYSFKLLIALGTTPFLYLGHSAIDRFLGAEEAHELIQESVKASEESII